MHPKNLTPEQKERLVELGYVDLFATRESIREALDYGYAIARMSDNPPHVIAALHVLLNTVALHVAREETASEHS